MKKRNVVILAFGIVVLLWLAFFITDSIRCENDKEPIFCVRISEAKDGGSIYYAGAFYNYYRVVQLNKIEGSNDEIKKTVDYVITPWFYSLEYAKNKAFKAD